MFDFSPTGEPEPKIVTDLRVARALIESGWCRNNEAVDGCGRTIDAHSDQAVAWCMGGAICRATGFEWTDQSSEPYLQALFQLLDKVMPTDGNSYVLDFVSFNDDIACSVEDVLAIFDAAINAALAAEDLTVR